MVSTAFDLHIGIDYSGAKSPVDPLAGLQVYLADTGHPIRVTSPMLRHKPWTRQGVAEWLIDQARSDKKFIAGIDHGFSFPQSYFKQYAVLSWEQFLEDFVNHWPLHQNDTAVNDVRFDPDKPCQRTGCPDEKRLTEKWTSSAKSVFQFGVPGSVAHSTHAGIPWLRTIKREVGERVHFWPFDGWQPPDDKSVIAEVYPSIFRSRFERQPGQTDDEHDAYAISRWLTEMDQRGHLSQYFCPLLTDQERTIADIEGWILGVM